MRLLTCQGKVTCDGHRQPTSGAPTRAPKGFSQGDVEKRTGLLRCHISRVENGYTIPSLATLEKLARALDLELYPFFFAGQGKPEAPWAAPKTPKPPRGSEKAEVLTVFAKISKPNRRLLLEMVRKMVTTERRRPAAKAKK